ncbi:MAG: hypothetical protein FD146_478 [Anaerolineaceae bacterium]|nr:MAG: hypothetical protein FD146_478 [Anaerolineaceae bacterium]
MLFPVPIILMLATALTLFILRRARPKFQYAWLIAAGGSLLALGGVFLWQVKMPQTFSLFAWQPRTVFSSTPAWLADGVSWPYALALTALAAAVILTSVARSERDPAAWAGTLILCALGIASVSAANLLTLVLIWAALDLAELVIMLRSTEGERHSEGVVVAFAARLSGIGLALWAGAASGPWADFNAAPAQAGLYLLLAAGLRLGVLPLHLPYRQENVLRRGFGTTLRLVSAASSLALLARIPPGAIASPFTPLLLVLAALAGLYAGWMWLRASDELTGRPFWVLGMASLAVAAALRGSPLGSAAWGLALVLGGGIIFLYSARQRTLLWIPFLGLLGLSALPFTATASGWQSGMEIFPLFWIILLPAQALLAAGFFRHALHPGESSLESQPRWVQALYPAGLLLPAAILLLLGVWGWDGAAVIGVWWAALVAAALAAGLAALALTVLPRLASGGGSPGQWSEALRLGWLYRSVWAFYRFLGRASRIITNALEGEGGILWSFLLLVLLLSVFSSLR